MEDTNNVEKIIKIVKIIFITIIIVGTVFVIISSIQRNKNFNNLNDYLISIGYKETEKNVLTKEEKKQNGDTVENINYIYLIESNKYTKEMINNNERSKEQISLDYNSTDTLKIDYYFEQYNNDNPRSYIIQSGTYNIKNSAFNCTITTNPNNIKTRCPQIKKRAEEFSKEIKNIINKAKINTFFNPKNSI